jgi:hypothetical protein
MFAKFWCSLNDWDIVDKINDSEESKVLSIIKCIVFKKGFVKTNAAYRSRQSD